MRWSGSLVWVSTIRNNNFNDIKWRKKKDLAEKINLKPVYRSHFKLLLSFFSHNYFELQMKMITCRSVYLLISTKVWWLDQMLLLPGLTKLRARVLPMIISWKRSRNVLGIGEVVRILFLRYVLVSSTSTSTIH